ncbi:hypothetical protein LX12_000897 [Williamsia serinedens]|uniref:Uncharacterized protein n=1 Tax=Williamsia serinedens TaxID=391736 RepID=A0ABT1GXL7_9NOCA|nr:hypothetical protein [Williamsia serinedens]
MLTVAERNHGYSDGVITAVLYGLATALPLAAGAAIGLRWTLPRWLLAGLMAFGAGTMIAAVSSELFEPAFRQAGPTIAGAALFAGAALYVVANRLIEQRLGPAAIGPALMLGSILDGYPRTRRWVCPSRPVGVWSWSSRWRSATCPRPSAEPR